MSLIALLFLALSLSMDAFAVSVGKGCCLRHVSRREAIRSGAIFGLVEAFNLLIGWSLGSVAGAFVTSVDHWIAFAILGGLGSKMIFECVRGGDEDCSNILKPTRHNLKTLVFAAVGSSIDSMGVGVTLAFIDQNIALASFLVGMATFTVASLGVYFGPVIGRKLGSFAEAVGGAVLILIGLIIVCEHTGVF